VIIINFKNYVLGMEALALAKIIQKANNKAIVAVPTVDIEEIASKTKLKVYAEHVDYIKGSKTTGYVIPESVKKVGGKGMLINHSEHKLNMREIKLTIARCKKLKMETVVCVSQLSKVKEIMKLKPKAIAYEDPKLISTGKSITKHDSKSVKKFASMFSRSKVIPLCGAGISSKEDIKAAKALGCKGVLIASAIARDKKMEILK
jgi:triosephosphate isomerase (TIM)